MAANMAAAAAEAKGALVTRSEHEQKYDRQTRIWGAHGQAAIEAAHVCALHAGPTSTETLKNLVLPNVGTFTVVDGEHVSRSDLENNFFVTEAQLGQWRAEAVRDNLLELNETVRGHFVARSPEELIAKDLGFFAQFTLVVASQLDEGPLLQLAEFLYARGIPLVAARAYGLIGHVRLAVPEITIVESHYDNDRHDLAVHPEQLRHFPALRAFVDEFADLAEIDDQSHVPYIVILVKLMDKWREKHGGRVPSSYEETAAFKTLIRESAREFGKQENFQEALTFAHRAYKAPELDDDVAATLSHEKASNLSANSADFWFLCRATRDFIANEGHGFAPVAADIPDMTARTHTYVRLKELYAARAKSDRDAIAARVRALLKAHGRRESDIPDGEIDYFVRNVRGISCVIVRSLAEEHDPKRFRVEDVNEAFEEYEEPREDLRPKDLYWYFGLRAVMRFKAQRGRFPGVDDALVEADADALEAITRDLFRENGVRAPVIRQCVEELVRLGPSEVHNVAAMVGGVAAQEALKVILRQFLPNNNTLIVNCIHARQTSLRL